MIFVANFNVVHETTLSKSKFDVRISSRIIMLFQTLALFSLCSATMPASTHYRSLRLTTTAITSADYSVGQTFAIRLDPASIIL